jgi:hypothetical protein
MPRCFLEQLGWNGFFTEAMAPVYEQGFAQARMIAEYRGLCRASGKCVLRRRGG